MQTRDIRRKFLGYFKNNGHQLVPSSSVIPHDDPTLLFINAGMNQFKDLFLGKSVRDYKRATSCQKCLRLGGKHNDFENVGHTKRHLTFFEMLGNFSFGDYFKKEVIKFSWELSTEVFGFDPQRLWPTVFIDDDEAFELWTAYVPPERITRFGEDENFWAMGDTGPCGPCSELLYDRGNKYGDAATPDCDAFGDRFLEFWNLVFMQYNRDESGVMIPLSKPSVDTGAGLERVVNLIMGVDSVFETDIFKDIIAGIENVSGVAYDFHDKNKAPAFHVIADHLRTLSFAIADGAQPSNVDRGYVLRKVLRRAVRYGRMLGMTKPFLADVLPRLVDSMGDDYDELRTAQGRIAEILTQEEESFVRTLKRGGNILGNVIADSKKHDMKISGEDAFKLKDTYGFPVEEIIIIAKDENMHVDIERFRQLEEGARELSRVAHKTVSQQAVADTIFSDYIRDNGPCKFCGYEELSADATVRAIFKDGKRVEVLQNGEEGMVILDRTSFYAEMGGQVGDTGILKMADTVFDVLECKSPYKGITAHIGKVVEGEISVGDIMKAHVDLERREKISCNHTATHLMHWALAQVLGEHVKQAGSIVEDDRLRFDFSHHKAMTIDDIRRTEDLVNAKIRSNIPVKWRELSYEDAQKSREIKQFFGDKYDSVVRVVDIEFSKELCGGTHVGALGNIGYFRIVKEGSIAAGVRRIEAVTGCDAEAFARHSDDDLGDIASKLKIHPNKLSDRIDKILEENKQLAVDIKEIKKKQLADYAKVLSANIETINDIPLIVSSITLPSKDLKNVADSIMSNVKSVVLVLANSSQGKCQLMVRVSEDFVGKGVKANEIIGKIAPIIGGGGGGKANAAQAGGKFPGKIPEALQKAREFFEA